MKSSFSQLQPADRVVLGSFCLLWHRGIWARTKLFLALVETVTLWPRSLVGTEVCVGWKTCPVAFFNHLCKDFPSYFRSAAWSREGNRVNRRTAGQRWSLSFKSQADLPSGTWKMNNVWDALFVGVSYVVFFFFEQMGKPSQTEISWRKR